MVTASRSEEGLVVMVDDGTCSQVVSEYTAQDTNTQEEPGNCKHFIDVWLDRMREQGMVARDWMSMDTVMCVQEVEDGDFPAVFRFIVQDG